MSAQILISTFPPFPTLSLSLPLSTPFSELPHAVKTRYRDFPSLDSFYVSPTRGVIHSHDLPLSDLLGEIEGGAPILTLRLTPRLPGGKGGFGSQLRAAGGRMSSQKTNNNDSCRDLNGRRLSTIKEAKKLAEYLENEPARKKAQAEAQKAKLEALERKLGIQPNASSSDAVSGSTDLGTLAGRKHRFDDTEYLEQSREIVDNVKSAVSAAMLKKKKAKTSHPSQDTDTATKGVEKAGGSSTTRVGTITGAISASVGA